MTVVVEQDAKKCAETPVWGPFDESAFVDAARAHAAPVLREWRAAAYRRYVELPAPHARLEEWRRTDPAVLPWTRLQRSPATAAWRTWALDRDGDADVLVTWTDGGHLAVGVRPDVGIDVRPLEQAAQSENKAVGELLLGPTTLSEFGKLEATHAAFGDPGLWISVGTHREDPVRIELEYRLTAPGVLWMPRLSLRLEPGARAWLSERIISTADGPALVYLAHAVHVGEDAHLDWASLQRLSPRTYYLAADWAHVERDGRLQWATIHLGGRVCVARNVCELRGPGSSAGMDGAFFASGRQHIDQRTLQIHASPDTGSRLLYNGAVRDRARSVYQGTIIAREGAIRVDAYQKNNNLVLSPEARADSIPGLLINADDLKCSHGATIGTLDPVPLFYLRSRGVPEAVARRLLITGFFEPVLERVAMEDVREEARAGIALKVEGAETPSA